MNKDITNCSKATNGVKFFTLFFFLRAWEIWRDEVAIIIERPEWEQRAISKIPRISLVIWQLTNILWTSQTQAGRLVSFWLQISGCRQILLKTFSFVFPPRKSLKVTELSLSSLVGNVQSISLTDSRPSLTRRIYRLTASSWLELRVCQFIP